METFSFVTTSKGRLHHIKQTLPLMMAQGADQVVVVDYGCPDGTAEWVEENHPDATIVRVVDDAGFWVARARNLGAQASWCDWLVFIDADTKSDTRWMGWMRQNVRRGNFFRGARVGDRRDPQTFGTCICARSDFEGIGGFDEVFRTWGGEDHDLYRRLEAAGVAETDFPSRFVSAIPHGDEERTGWGGLQSRAERVILSLCYVDAKLQFARFLSQSDHLPLALREQLMKHTFETLQPWFESGAKQPLHIDYILDQRSRWVPDPYRMTTELRFTITVAGAQAELVQS